ncbi:putative poly(U)-binding-splicing factor half pint-like [Penaeus vannamei]|uniref:Putative poly(U)-binding-splicing factor half pint-like n=1 Tax=Penaeus vannamei TaxID=6689 RepID=A0A3R7PTZ4_PENVA|nr:putative poly(U)-binding-splicing factor half pint-like [Penaeus vannamei]
MLKLCLVPDVFLILVLNLTEGTARARSPLREVDQSGSLVLGAGAKKDDIVHLLGQSLPRLSSDQKDAVARKKYAMEQSIPPGSHEADLGTPTAASEVSTKTSSSGVDVPCVRWEHQL